MPKICFFKGMKSLCRTLLPPSFTTLFIAHRLTVKKKKIVPHIWLGFWLLGAAVPLCTVYISPLVNHSAAFQSKLTTLRTAPIGPNNDAALVLSPSVGFIKRKLIEKFEQLCELPTVNGYHSGFLLVQLDSLLAIRLVPTTTLARSWNTGSY